MSKKNKKNSVKRLNIAAYASFVMSLFSVFLIPGFMSLAFAWLAFRDYNKKKESGINLAYAALVITGLTFLAMFIYAIVDRYSEPLPVFIIAPGEDYVHYQNDNKA